MVYIIPQLFKYTQATPASVWTITHNLNSNGSGGYPTVDVISNSTGQNLRVNPISIVHLGANVVELTFSAPTSGYALVTV